MNLTTFNENRLRLIANIFFVAVIFPYLSPFETPFDTQPWALLIAAVFALMFFDIPRPLAPLFVIACYASLIFAIGLLRRTSVPLDGLRSLAVYLSVFVIAYAAYRLYHYLSVKIFLAGVGVWLAAAILQIVIHPQIFGGIVPRTSPLGYRGFTSLAPEPAYYAKVMIGLFVLNEIFHKEKKYGHRLYLAVAAALIVQIVLSFAAIGMVYIAAGAVAKAIALVWERSRQDRLASCAVIVLFISALVAFQVVPGLNATRAGDILKKTISEGQRAVFPAKKQPWGDRTSRKTPYQKESFVKRDPSIMTRAGNLVLGFYGGIVETRGMGFGLGSKPKGEIPTWLSRILGASRPWGGRIGGGLVQGVYELGAVGLLFFFIPLWIIVMSCVRNRSLRSALLMTLCLMYPAAAISESPAFPLFGCLLGIHAFLGRKKTKELNPARAPEPRAASGLRENTEEKTR